MSNDNIIPFRVKHEPNMEWQATVEMSKSPEGRWGADIAGFRVDGRSVPDRLRELADGMEAAALSMHKKAEDMDPTERGSVVAVATIYDSSTVKVRVAPGTNTTEEQRAWIDDRFDDAKRAARET